MTIYNSADITMVKETRVLNFRKGLNDNGRWKKDNVVTVGGLTLNGAAVLSFEAKQVVEKTKEIVKESLSEYFLYTVEGRDTIPTGWSKRLPSFKTPDVPITSYYKFEKEHWGDQVIRYYRFTNSEPSNLGREPLPDGDVKAFRAATDDNLYAFVGRTSVKYIPVNETVDANKVKFVVPLKAREKRQFSYDVTMNLGSNATR